MKRRTITIFSTLFLIVVTMNNGCKKVIHLTTTVNMDGSLLRIVEVEQNDSTSVPHGAFPIPQDSTWTISTKRVHKDSSKFIYRAEKLFKNADDLNSFFYCDSDTILKTKVKADFKKRFRWFFTFFEYHETYTAFNQFKLLPVSKYMTEQELDAYWANDDSSELGEKFDEWLQRAIFEEYYQILIAGAKRFNSPQFSPELIESRKEILYTTFKTVMDSDNEEMKNLIGECEKVLNSSVIVQLEPDLQKWEKSVTTRFEFFGAAMDDSFISTVIMPGLLIDTNAVKIEGNQVTWNVTPGQYFLRDFAATAVSRVTNKWAIHVTLAICAVILAGLAVAVIRSKR